MHILLQLEFSTAFWLSPGNRFSSLQSFTRSSTLQNAEKKTNQRTDTPSLHVNKRLKKKKMYKQD